MELVVFPGNKIPVHGFAATGAAEPTCETHVELVVSPGNKIHVRGPWFSSSKASPLETCPRHRRRKCSRKEAHVELVVSPGNKIPVHGLAVSAEQTRVRQTSSTGGGTDPRLQERADGEREHSGAAGAEQARVRQTSERTGVRAASMVERRERGRRGPGGPSTEHKKTNIKK